MADVASDGVEPLGLGGCFDAFGALLEPHREWLNKQLEAGIFLVAGRREPRDGGFILAADGNRAEMERLAATDPFATAGVARYDVLEVRPTIGAPEVLAALAAHGIAVPTT